MTVIVGVAATSEPAVVLAADKRTVNGDYDLHHSIMHIMQDSRMPLSEMLDSFLDMGCEGAVFTSGHKLFSSSDGQSALARTGTANEAQEKAMQFLLSTNEFLADKELLRELFAPWSGREMGERVVQEYLASFDFARNAERHHLPEIRRIFEKYLTQGPHNEIDGQPFLYAKRRSPQISNFLFSTTRVYANEPILMHITYTGAVDSCLFMADGSGAEHALEYLRTQLEFMPGEKLPVCRVQDAVELARGAVAQACENDLFCKGFEYMIITPRGVESHLNAEDVSGTLTLDTLIEKRVQQLDEERSRLSDIDEAYRRAKETYDSPARAHRREGIARILSKRQK